MRKIVQFFMDRPSLSWSLMVLAVILSAHVFLGPIDSPPPGYVEPIPTETVTHDTSKGVWPQTVDPEGPIAIADIDRLWRAICKVESDNRPHIINPCEGAVGIAQIHPICLYDVNRIVTAAGGPEGLYDLRDRADVGLSRQIWLTYVVHYAPDGSAQDWARIWNGGPRGNRKQSTLKYWRRVQAAMEGR